MSQLRLVSVHTEGQLPLLVFVAAFMALLYAHSAAAKRCKCADQKHDLCRYSSCVVCISMEALPAACLQLTAAGGTSALQVLLSALAEQPSSWHWFADFASR